MGLIDIFLDTVFQSTRLDKWLGLGGEIKNMGVARG